MIDYFFKFAICASETSYLVRSNGIFYGHRPLLEKICLQQTILEGRAGYFLIMVVVQQVRLHDEFHVIRYVRLCVKSMLHAELGGSRKKFPVPRPKMQILSRQTFLMSENPSVTSPLSASKLFTLSKIKKWVQEIDKNCF